MCKHEFVEASATFLTGTVFRRVCRYCMKTPREIELEQQLAAAKAELAAEQEKVKHITQKLIFAETMFRMPHNVATDTGITFKIATMQEFNRAEMYKEKLVQAEAQCKRMEEALRNIPAAGHNENCMFCAMKDFAAKAALEDKP